MLVPLQKNENSTLPIADCATKSAIFASPSSWQKDEWSHCEGFSPRHILSWILKQVADSVESVQTSLGEVVFTSDLPNFENI